MRNHAGLLVATLGNFRAGLSLIMVIAKQLLWFSFLAWTVVGCIDFALSHRIWLKKLMMSHEEKRHEQKETEGDPIILSQRARFRLQLLSEATNWSVREATLVIQHAMRIAAVLHYDPTDVLAPRLLGVGTAELAAIIVAEAHRFDIPVVEHRALAQKLVGSVVGDPIPENLYSQVAELMSLVLT